MTSKEMVIELLSKEDKYKEQIAMGKEVEKEHEPTVDKIEDEYGIEVDKEKVFKSIADDHLDEFDDYYDRLEDMEEEAEKEHEQKEEGVV